MAVDLDPSGLLPEAPPERDDKPPKMDPVVVWSDGAGTLSFGDGGFTTVRACHVCGVLIVGGPTCCRACAKDGFR